LRKIEIIRVGLQVWLTGGCKEGLPSDPPNEIETILRVLGVWGAQICQIWMFRASTESKFFTKLEKAKKPSILGPLGSNRPDLTKKVKFLPH
jgi:hypothetical protein